MDFLDSLDLHTNDKKSNRMRSWYLYEQYKSLERHQLEAAEKLKHRSDQERLLQRELAERRARRRLYSRCGPSLSEPRFDLLSRGSHDARSALGSTDDFYESFCELNDDFQTVEESIGGDSQPDSDIDIPYMEDFKTLEGRDDTSYAASITSVVEKADNCDAVYSNQSMAEKLQSVQRNIAENISLQLETVKENMLCLEKYAGMSDGEKTSEEESVDSLTRPSPKVGALDKDGSFYDSNVFNMWSRLVSFAYQVIQLNHGNCYYDYSSQLMTAVLACDVLRRGVNRMCDILQPYVSPIKFADVSVADSINTYKNAKRKKFPMSTNIGKSPQLKINSSVYKMYATRGSRGNYHSDKLWRNCSKYSFDNKYGRKNVRGSEPWRGGGRNRSSSSGSYWPQDLESDKCECFCCCHKQVVNPMLKLVRHLDKMLKSDFDSFVKR